MWRNVRMWFTHSHFSLLLHPLSLSWSLPLPLAYFPPSLFSQYSRAINGRCHDFDRRHLFWLQNTGNFSHLPKGVPVHIYVYVYTYSHASRLQLAPDTGNVSHLPKGMRVHIYVYIYTHMPPAYSRLRKQEMSVICQKVCVCIYKYIHTHTCLPPTVCSKTLEILAIHQKLCVHIYMYIYTHTHTYRLHLALKFSIFKPLYQKLCVHVRVGGRCVYSRM